MDEKEKLVLDIINKAVSIHILRKLKEQAIRLQNYEFTKKRIKHDS